MPEVKEIPELTKELLEMSRAYVLQETVEPAKRLGKVAGISLAAGALLAFAALFLTLAALQLAAVLLPEGRLWVALGAFIVAVLAGVAAFIIVRGATR